MQQQQGGTPARQTKGYTLGPRLSNHLASLLLHSVQCSLQPRSQHDISPTFRTGIQEPTPILKIGCLKKPVNPYLIDPVHRHYRR